MYWLSALLISLAALLAVMVLRALSGPKAAPATGLDKGLLLPYAGAEDRLAALIRIPTVSSFKREEEDEAAFARFKAELKAQYPLVHERLLVSEPSDRSLLIEWPGRKRESASVILCAHYDVVPAGDSEQWEHLPFSGAIVDGFVHGRGTQDIKIMLASAMGAAEASACPGLRAGAHGILRLRRRRGSGRPARRGGYSGGTQAEGAYARPSCSTKAASSPTACLSFADRPLALIGISEKGYMDVALEAQGTGGHASDAAAAHRRRRRGQGGNRYRGAAFPGQDHLHDRRPAQGPLALQPLLYRFLFRNLFLTAPLVKAAFSAAPLTNALLRTTSAATMLSGSAEGKRPARKRRAPC